MPVPAMVASILDWLRAGYPEGVPPKDYFPLLALLHRGLSREEVRSVAAELLRDGPLEVTDEAIVRLATGITNEPPSEADLSRVRARLAAGGWPGADAEANGT
jgi:hypothetical protein